MDFMALSDTEIIELATPLMDSLMDASTNIDYEAHIKDFSTRLLGQISKDRFIEMCKRYQDEIGFLKERELVGVFKRPNSAVVIWKQHLSKAQGEFVAEMVLVKEDDKFKVDHALFF